MHFVYDEEVLARMVRNWAELKGLQFVPRAGYARYGTYKLPPDAQMNRFVDPNRWESDLEHTAGLWKLVKLLQLFFPDRFFEYYEYQDALEIAELHEIGEKVTGDVCDDGTRNAELLDQMERDFIQQVYLADYSDEELISRLFGKFVEFQERSTLFGRTMYCLDKTEAMLQSLIYEACGRGGRLNPYRASAMEAEGMRIAGTNRTVDIWLYSFVKNAKDYECFRLCLELVIKAAQMLTDESSPFLWLDNVLK